MLWDDAGSGFCLWLHWDWAANRPAKVDPADPRRCGAAACGDLYGGSRFNHMARNRGTRLRCAAQTHSREPGWYQNVAPLLTAPLLDPAVGEDALAAWIDANTLRCHKLLLERLHTARPRARQLQTQRRAR